MDVTQVLNLLKKKIGLNAASIGQTTVEKSVRRCMSECGASSVYDYLRKLQDHPAELTRLIERVVIPETFFFRDKTPFAALEAHLREFRLQGEHAAPLRILSLPCSTGEEPFSIAMLLFDMGVCRDDFHIDAVDISEQHLAVARRGIYRPYSFRGNDLGYRDRYFVQEGEEYRLKDEVRNAVNFEQGNLLAEEFISQRGCYDIIFCRNLLIYFDDATKKTAIQALSELLCSEGVLFVGHAETTTLSMSGYAQLDYPMAFAFSKTQDAEAFNVRLLNSRQPRFDAERFEQKRPPWHRDQEGTSGPAPKTPRPTSMAVNKGPEAAPTKEEVKREEPDAEDQLAKAKKLADEGALEEAIAICEELIQKGVESAQVHYLLGQTLDATGNIYRAESHLRTAIYLDPGFYDALSYLAVISERLGDMNKAAAFRRRAERVRQRLSAGSAR